MTETQEAHAKGAARLTTLENADDAFREVTEELVALRAIVEAAAAGIHGISWKLTIFRGSRPLPIMR